MKRFLLSLFTISISFCLFAQTSTSLYPCVNSYTGNNLGGGNCATAGTGNSKYYPGYLTQSASPLYLPTGKITVLFKFAIPVGVPAPEILAAGPDDGQGGIVPGQTFDYRYRADNDDVTVARTSVKYCYYGSASNQNIFNGQKAPKLTFILKYSSTTSSGATLVTLTCSNIREEATLPVTYTSFNAVRKNSVVTLTWETASEENNKGFYIQRNTGGDWKDVAFVFSAAANGNSNSNLSYAYNDANASKGASQYRILQVDIDGKGRYSEIRSVRGLEQAARVVVFPNPSTDKINVLFEEAQSVRDITVTDIAGRVVKQYRNITSNSLSIDNLKDGFYNIQVTDRHTGTTVTEKAVMKKR